MKKHPDAGFPVKVEKGPMKGQYVQIIDYLVNQFQGKQIEKIAKAHPELTQPVVTRGYPLDDKIVYVELLPTRQRICLHHEELKMVQPPLKLVEEEKENGTQGPSTTDSEPTQPGPAEPDGRSVPSAKADGKDKPKPKRKG